MKKRLFRLGLSLIVVLGIIGCNSIQANDHNLTEPIDYQVTKEGIIKPELAKEAISEVSDRVIKAIREKDGRALAEYVHSKGVRFTPYTSVSVERDIVFSKGQVQNFFNDHNAYIWGQYDGTGEDIVLTPSEYYDKFIYSVDFMNPEEIGYNEILSSGNMRENQFEVYERAIVVEYYFSGFHHGYGGADWQSLRLVFQQDQSTWKLVGVIHNQWTV